jgi:hypothetical protein
MSVDHSYTSYSTTIHNPWKTSILTKINGIIGSNLPLSQAPPTEIAQTVASKINWNSLNRIAGIVPTGSARTPI